MESKIQVKNLAVSFRVKGGKAQAVRGVSFDLFKGETLAIVGESGSGKSVTSKAIMGILPGSAIIEHGEILYDQKDLTKLPESQFQPLRGTRLAMIFQDPFSALNPIMKVGKQITECMLLKDKLAGKNGKTSKKLAKEKAIKLMEEVGISQPELRYHQYPFELSGGMRQRIVIAIALSADPEVLICDEPTTALDVTIQAQILELIKKLKKERDLSVIFITHDLGVVANVADRVAVMYAGKIVEYGTAEEIFYEPKHPYTWALLCSMPDLNTKDKLASIPFSPPNMLHPPKGDAFALRSEYAMRIDFEKEPPMVWVSETHAAATWLLHPNAPKVKMPEILQKRIRRAKRNREKNNESE